MHNKCAVCGVLAYIVTRVTVSVADEQIMCYVNQFIHTMEKS
jgi:hypothetical protein